MPPLTSLLVLTLGAVGASALQQAARGGSKETARFLSEQRAAQHLWEGLDLPAGSPLALDQALGLLRLRRRVGGTTQGRDVLLLGPYDSGTNLVTKMIADNWPSTVSVSADGEANWGVWKHSLGLEEIYSILENATGHTTWPNVALIAMVRSPISQVYSWIKAPYTIDVCVERGIPEWNEPCWGWLQPADHQAEGFYGGAGRTDFNNTMDIINLYLRQYNNLVKSDRFGAALILPYEDVVVDPKSSLQRIAEVLQLPAPLNMVVEDSASKEHGGAHGRAQALEVLHDRPWQNFFKPGWTRDLCDMLDMSLLKNLHEASMDSNSSLHHPYTYDCDLAYATDEM